MLPAGDMPTIGPGYERAAEATVELELRRAGMRLAAVLNTALKLGFEPRQPRNSRRTGILEFSHPM